MKKTTLILGLFLILFQVDCAKFKTRMGKNEQSAIDTLQKLTGHLHLHPWRTPEVITSGLNYEELLGHIINGASDAGSILVGGKGWYGMPAGVNDADAPISIDISGKTFLDFKNVLEKFFGLTFSVERSYRVKLEANWHAISYNDPQPTLEFLGDESIFTKKFISSIAFASKLKLTTFVENKVGNTIELVPLPIGQISTDMGASKKQENTMEASNVIFGYQETEGTNWVKSKIEAYPMVTLKMLKPKAEDIIQSPRVSIQVQVMEYPTPTKEQQGKLQVYLWIQQVGKNNGYLSHIGSPIDVEKGIFEFRTVIGGLEDGNGERYSIYAFALYYRLYNVNERTDLPTTSFTRPARDNGHVSLVVERRDAIN